METLVLECWVYLEDVNNIFYVEIPHTETVSGLKEAIKNEKPVAFGSVHARNLSLYTIPSSDDLEDQLKLWDPTGKTKLSGRKKLSLEFSGPDKAVIVCPPPTFVSRTSIAPSVPDMSLTCWIRGLPIDLVYVVKVSSSQTVADLKDAIKDHNKYTFSDLDAHDLTLYKVSLPCPNDDASKGKFGSLSISTLEDKERLVSVQKKLSAIFSPPLVEDNIHLIVEGHIPVRCWIRGANAENSFQVQTLVSTTVDELKNVIKAASEDLREHPPNRLNLYNIQDTDIIEALATQGSGCMLHPNKHLREIFDSVSFSCIPLVVVDRLENKVSRPPPSTYHYIGNDDPIAIARAAFLKAVPKDRPSNIGTPSSFRSRQNDITKYTPCGLPRDREETIPTTLLHPVFGQFLDDCRSINLTDEDIKFTVHLANAMSDIYRQESDRVEAVKAEFRKYSIHFTSTTKTGCVMDSGINTDGHHYVIAEFKNEIGNTSSEPYSQAIGCYLESTRDLALKFTRSPLPCLLLVIFGSHMEFAGAAWNLRPTTQPLSPSIIFHFHSTDHVNRNMVARHMAAFRNATRTLKKYYEGLRETLPLTSAPVPVHMFPHPTSYKSRKDRTLKNFHYIIDLDEERLIFHGEGDDGRIRIKFVQAYSCGAHEYLANLHCAPDLYGFEKVPGGWFMVVMESLSDDFETLFRRRPMLSDAVFDDMKTKMKLFHDAGFVHGDIRDTNIMVSKEDEKRFMFVDFDWAGLVDQVRYPAGMNREGIKRPGDVCGGNLIKIKHDEEMLENIISNKHRD